MLSTSAFAGIAALIGEPARANMLAALMDGRALTAAELARSAGVTAQTASGHLARLTEGGILAVERQGRHRYHRLASPTVARMLEGIMSVAADQVPPAPRTGPRDAALRRARTCYDHLAGRVAVAIAEGMAARRQIEWSVDGGALTPDGEAFLRGLGMELAPQGRRVDRVFCRPCLDWSERRPHIAGRLGAMLCQHCLAQGWLRRVEGSRALSITPAGKMALRQNFGFRLEEIDNLSA